MLTVAAQPRGVARSYLDQHQLARLPVVEDDLHAVTDAYSVGPIPATVIVNRNGTVARVMIGGFPWDDLKGAVEAVLAPAGP